MVMLAKVTTETAREVPHVANVIATVANMCCGMVQRRVYKWVQSAECRVRYVAVVAVVAVYGPG